MRLCAVIRIGASGTEVSMAPSGFPQGLIDLLISRGMRPAYL